MINLPFFRKSGKKTTKFLSVNINSKDVRCLAFYPSDNTYKIIGYGKQDLEKGNVRNGEFIDKENLIETTKNALAEALENLEDKTTDVIFGVGGNLSLGLMTTIRYKKPAKEIVDSKEIKEIYEKLAESAYMQAQNEYLETTGNADIELENITSADVYIKVDGHKVKTLEGAEGQIIEIAVFNAFSPSYHIKAIQDVAKKTGLNIIAIGSETYSMAQWIKESFRDQEDFIIIDVAEDSTNVAVVFGGGIAASKNLDIGRTHFVEGISEKMGLNVKEAEKVLKSYLNEKLSESESSVVQNCLIDILSIWLEGIKLVFSEFTNVKIFPSRIFVGGNGAEIRDISFMLKNEPWTKSVPFKSSPEIIKYNLSDFSRVIDSTGRVNGSEWLSCISMTIIYQEIYKE